MEAGEERQVVELEGAEVGGAALVLLELVGGELRGLDEVGVVVVVVGALGVALGVEGVEELGPLLLELVQLRQLLLPALLQRKRHALRKHTELESAQNLRGCIHFMGSDMK